MIDRNDILSIDYLKKSEYTGCYQGMRYRLEGISADEGKKLKVTLWPEPFNFFKTAPEKKRSNEFTFSEEGIVSAVAWMNERFEQDHDKWEYSWEKWDEYRMD